MTAKHNLSKQTEAYSKFGFQNQLKFMNDMIKLPIDMPQPFIDNTTV